jgi:hypothetical protein
LSLAWLATLAKLDWIRSIRPSNHSWDPFAGEIVFSDFVWSVCQSLCSPTSPRFGGALDGCPVVSPFLDKFAISKAAQWQRRLHCYSDFPIPLRLSCSADVETDMKYISGGRRMDALAFVRWLLVNLERWYGFLFGCRRIFSDWAGFWIALKNGRRCIRVLIGRFWYGLYCYTMCIGTCMDLQERYRSG